MTSISRHRSWNLAESMATPETVFMSRRQWTKRALGGLAIVASPPLMLAGCETEEPPTLVESNDPSKGLYPVARNDRYQADQPITEEALATTYNNFVEFGSHKRIYLAAQKLRIRPWTLAVDGLVEKPLEIGIDDLLKEMPLEERIYRHRCVETWAMVVPWSGFPLAALIDRARPLGSAKYIQFETFNDKSMASGQNAFWYPWPYTEALTMAEAGNQLAFMVTGAYGKPLPKQNGSPLRLALPWKYGFKSAKSIQRISFVEERPKTFWEEVAGDEYGFWANVNPDVPHPRWSQKTERLLGTKEEIPTRLFNGYADMVADLYPDRSDETLFR